MKRIRNLVLALLLACSLATLVQVPQQALAATGTTTTATTTKLKLNAKVVDFYVGGIYNLELGSISPKRVKWKSSNTRIATVNKKGKVTARRVGTCTVTGKYKNKTYRCKIRVYTDKRYLKNWCRWLGKSIKAQYSSPYDRVLAATWYVNTNFGYGKASSAFDVLKKGRGTCVSGNKLLAEILKAMGFKAKVRFAAHDNMSRYPSNIMFMSDHHNVKVTINGKTYFVDGTPASGCIYMSTTTKPIYFAYTMPGYESVVTDEVPIS